MGFSWIGSLRSDKGVSVTSIRGKLHMLQKHYKDLGRKGRIVILTLNVKSKLKLKSVCAVVHCVKMSI